MFGEIKTFRRRLFGGFSQRDVIGYIGLLAEERNSLRAAKDSADRDARALRDELTALRCELEESERRSLLVSDGLFAEAFATLTELEAACESVREDVGAASVHMRSELDRVGDAVAQMSSALKKTEQRLSELRTSSGPKNTEVDESGAEDMNDAETA